MLCVQFLHFLHGSSISTKMLSVIFLISIMLVKLHLIPLKSICIALYDLISQYLVSSVNSTRHNNKANKTTNKTIHSAN